MTSLPIRFYVDTCIFGGAFDSEFSTAVNVREGYRVLAIYSPLEVIGDDEEIV